MIGLVAAMLAIVLSTPSVVALLTLLRARARDPGHASRSDASVLLFLVPALGLVIAVVREFSIPLLFLLLLPLQLFQPHPLFLFLIPFLLIQI